MAEKQPTVEEVMKQQADRLDKEEASIQKEIDTLTEKLSKLQKQKDAIRAYYETLSGKTRRQQGPRGERRSGVKEQVLQTIKNAPAGIKAGDVLRNLGAQEDKKYASSIYQALASLKKDNKVVTEEGLYKPT